MPQEIYDLVQVRLAALDYQAGAGEYLLSGLTYCGLCGGSMIVACSKRNAINPWGVSPRFRCRAALSDRCQHKESYPVFEVQAGVVEMLIRWLEPLPTAQGYMEAYRCAELAPLDTPDDLCAKAAAAGASIDRLIKAQAATPGASEDYARQIRELVDARAKLRARIEKVEALRDRPATISPQQAVDALKVFLRDDLPKNLSAIVDEDLAHAVQRFRDLFIGMMLSPAPGRSRFIFQCDTVLGSATGAAFVRHQRINDNQFAIVAALKQAQDGLRRCEILRKCQPKQLGALKSAISALLRYGLLERCGSAVSDRLRLAIPMQGDGPWIIVRQEVKLAGVQGVRKSVRSIPASQTASS